MYRERERESGVWRMLATAPACVPLPRRRAALHKLLRCSYGDYTITLPEGCTSRLLFV